MKTKGYITIADYYKKDPEDAEETDLHIEDLKRGPVAHDDDTTTLVRVWIRETDTCLEFTRGEAKTFMTAIQNVVNRYEITAEEWEAKHA